MSGLAAAIGLAEAGRTVEVLEKAPGLGSRAGDHTEGLRNYGTADALEELAAYGIRIEPFATAHTTVRRSRRFLNVLHGPAYYLVARGEGPGCVDRQLYDRAVRAGVQVRFGVEARPEEVDIVATGHPAGRESLFSVGYTFTRPGSALDEGTLYALLDNDIAPGGYFAVAPGPETHSLYTVAWTDLDPSRLWNRLEAALRLPWVRELLGSSRRVQRIAGGAYFSADPIAEAVSPSGALRVGEAAGFQDPIAGYGVRCALITGALAARSLVEGTDFRDLLRNAFGTEFQEAFAFRKQLDRATNDDMDRLVESMGPEMDLAAYRRHRSSRLL